MDVKYRIVIALGVALCVVLLFLKKKAKKSYLGGKKVIGLSDLQQDEYFIRKMQQYNILRWIRNGAALLVILLCAVLIARPYTTEIKQEEKYGRDIILCMDMSLSVINLNEEIVHNFRETVKQLHGERVGVIFFNCTSVLMSPLTDDYEYIDEILENAEIGCQTGAKYWDGESLSSELDDNEEDLKKFNYIYDGTAEDNGNRGSSLIADGLVNAVYNFSNLEEKRTRVVIFSTDNQAEGSSLVTLSEAADICKENNVVIYGVGTKGMESKNKASLEQCVKATGGELFVQGESGTVSKIVNNIEGLSKSLIKGREQRIEREKPLIPTVIMIIFLFMAIGLTVYTEGMKKKHVDKIIAIVMALLAIVIAVRPTLPKGKIASDEKKLEANVVFVMDRTVSMDAVDGRNGSRLKDMKEDVENIVDKLNGARFSIITFDNTAKKLFPCTDDYEVVKNAISNIRTVDDFYGKGSTLNVVKDELSKSIKSQKEHSDYPTVVFVLSDGEITNDEELTSFSDLEETIDYGAVLGYGTKQGAEMKHLSYYDEKTYDTIYDKTNNYEIAISKLDEDNLNNLSSDLGIDYVHMEKKSDINATLDNILKNCKVINEKGEVDGSIETYYIFAIILLGLMVVFYYRNLMRNSVNGVKERKNDI